MKCTTKQLQNKSSPPKTTEVAVNQAAMPATRIVPGLSQAVKFRPISEIIRRIPRVSSVLSARDIWKKVTVVQKRSRPAHLASQKHKTAAASYLRQSGQDVTTVAALGQQAGNSRLQVNQSAPAPSVLNSINFFENLLDDDMSDDSDKGSEPYDDQNWKFYGDNLHPINLGIDGDNNVASLQLENDLRDLDSQVVSSRMEGQVWLGAPTDVHEGHEEPTVTILEEAMQRAGISGDDEDDENDDGDNLSRSISDNEPGWAPHGNKTMFMLDLLDNLPRLRLSDDHMRTIMWVMRECGTPNVPSFYALRKLQAQMTKETAIVPRPHASVMGNHFYMNHPLDLLALDWANPLVRDDIHVYPEISDTISESWQARKWLDEVDLQHLSPMWADWKGSPHRHFFVNEVAQLESGEFVVPMRWVTVKKQVHVEYYIVQEDKESGKASLSGPDDGRAHHRHFCRAPAVTLKSNWIDLQKQGLSFRFDKADLELCNAPYLGQTEHPSRTVAKGRPVFVLRLMPWCDDVSGNRSKQFNPHVNMYASNTSLPHQRLSQEYFVRFCATTPNASSLELFEALSEDFGKFKSAYDCRLEQEIIFQVFPHALPADNPQQAESSSCGGLGGSHNCRYDTNGGSKVFKESADGYHSMFSPGEPRTPIKTIEIVSRQLRTACSGVAQDVQDIQKETGVKDKIALHWIDQLLPMAQERIDTQFKAIPPSVKKEARRDAKDRIRSKVQDELFAWLLTQPPERYALLPESSEDRKRLRPGDHYNKLLAVPGVNPHRDSPCELLHTYLLGQAKYVWYDTTHKWSKEKDDLFATRLEGSSLDGLSITSLRPQYCVQYKGSLIGKHYKALQQLGVFHLDSELCNPRLFELWKATGELGALLWYPTIRDQKGYLEDLNICIANVLDLWAAYDPNRIISKFKLHALTHLEDDIKRLGPAILFATEVFECWNVIFRICSVLSNHLSPSHDIADTIAGMERFKHLVSGGFWLDTKSKKWIQAGAEIASFLKTNSELQRRLGWASPNLFERGTVKLKARKHQNASSWKDAFGGLWKEEYALENANMHQPINWLRGQYVIAQSRDICRENSWVFSQVQEAQIVAGRIKLILIPFGSSVLSDGANARVLIEVFNVSNCNDKRLNMPTLTPAGYESLVYPKDIRFLFNAQHDCQTAQCKLGSKAVLQERQLTSRTTTTVVHGSLQLFFINMHALHNAHYIRDTLPRNLTKPVLKFPNRRAHHDRIAASLQITNTAKRNDTLAKSAATRERNKSRKALLEDAQSRIQVDEERERQGMDIDTVS